MPQNHETLAAIQRNLTIVVRRAAVPRAHERIINRAGVEIDRVEAIALSRVADAGSMRVTELADQLGVACSTAGRHAANLEAGGLVARSPDPDDGRVTVVTVGDRGMALIKRLREAQGDLLAQVLADWEAHDLDRLAILLGRLSDDLLVLSEPESVEA